MAFISSHPIASAHHQDRTGGVADDSFGGAADEDMLPTGITMSGDHDKVPPEIFGGLSDLIPRGASFYDPPADQTRIDTAFLRQTLELSFCFFGELAGWDECRRILPAGYWLDDMQEVQRAAAFFRQLLQRQGRAASARRSRRVLKHSSVRWLARRPSARVWLAPVRAPA